MSGWQSASIKPPADQDVLVRTEGGRVFKAQWGYPTYDENGDCTTWSAAEDVAPDSWCDGVCWGSNSAGVASEPVVSWRALDRPSPVISTEAVGGLEEGLGSLRPDGLHPVEPTGASPDSGGAK